jgi:predicted unusual protein kinase regulating ubiquinone biosynthesis (AarF/ABC1/UbiB family)
MEVLKIAGIGCHEWIKSVVKWKPFDKARFWERCISMNIIYAKFFQSVAAKYNLHTAVHTIPYTMEEISYPVDIDILNVIGSGLISIVFEGILNKEHVVIKTKRKNIEQRVQSSLTTLRRIVSWIHYFYPNVTMMDAYEEIVDTFNQQMNFEKEMENHERFKTLFETDEIKVPTLIKDKCTPDQIVMTKLYGTPLCFLTEEEKQKSVERLSKLIVKSITDHGFVHADLHVGNLLFDKDYLGIIDFGFMIHLTAREKQILVDLFKQFGLGELKEASETTMNFIEPEHVRMLLTDDEKADIQDYIVHIYQCALEVDQCFSVYDLSQISKKLRKYSLSFSPLFYKMALSLNSVESVMTKLSASSADIFIHAIVSFLS